MKIFFCTNVPSPYRVDFFNEFGKYCDLTVLYERKSSSERDSSWNKLKAESFKEIYLDLKPVGVDRARGTALKDYIKVNRCDILIFTNYVSPATMSAIAWCRIHGRKYYIEYDGGFYRKDSLIKGLLKSFLLKGATAHLSTADEHIGYLINKGIPKNCIYKYPFSSVRVADIEKAMEDHKKGRDYFREILGIKEKKVVLAVGQFIPRKGFDILLYAAKYINPNIGVYIVGGIPTQEYITIKEENILENVHFVGFKSKEELSYYYQVADCFVHPTREDIWGLVVNEALSYGLPVISTDKCIAALEMIKDGINGKIVKSEQIQELAEAISDYINVDTYNESISAAQLYTIETMTAAHRKFFIK